MPDHETTRLSTIETAAKALLNSDLAENSRRAFATDWRHWQQFCANENIDPLCVSSGLLVAFVTCLAHDTPARKAQSPATLQRRLAGVLHGWKQAGCTIPHAISADALRIIRSYERNLRRENLPTGRGSAPAITIDDLRKISATCPSSLAGMRDRALILLGFAIGARRSELAALLVTDIKVTDEGLVVTLRDSKTGYRQPHVLPGTDGLTCPVRAWLAWRFAAELTEGSAFWMVNKHGDLVRPLTPQAVGNIVTQAGNRAGCAARFTGHSLRAGLATEARKAGHDRWAIADQGGWQRNSAVLDRYIQIVDRWSDNALKGIGL